MVKKASIVTENDLQDAIMQMELARQALVPSLVPQDITINRWAQQFGLTVDVAADEIERAIRARSLVKVGRRYDPATGRQVRAYRLADSEALRK